jgi:predicted O-methyltransferase YrrM
LALLMQLLASAERDAQLDNAEFVPPGHFYSAVPSRAERTAYLEREAPVPDALAGIDLREAQQLELLDALAACAADCPFPEAEAAGSLYHFDNPAYAYADGLTLHAMLRHFRPRRVIEVGSGYSTCAILDTRRHFPDAATEITCIEPYPELLRARLGDKVADLKLIEAPVQAVELARFETLEAGDFLIIDSPHVGKLSSDVLHLLFEVLPALHSGVLVHFHDIFWPFDYPGHWIREGRAWNEAYLLRAFLQDNAAFEIVYFYSYLAACHRERIAARMPLCLKRPGANLWLRKGGGTRPA